MPELYKNEFISLYNKKKENGYRFFDEYSKDIEGVEFKYLVCNIDLDILKCAIHLAKEKSKFTMNQNQARIPRDKVTKLTKSAQGVLAEMFIHILLIDRYGFNVLRYDLERQTFEYKTDEYDLKIVINDNCYEVESRSSNIHYECIENFIKNDVIIGPYGNSIKPTDEFADFHFRPIYTPDFIPFCEKGGKYYYDQNMINGKIKLIITGVATKEDFIKNSYKTSLGQKGTMYYVVKANQIGDIKEMDNKFKKIKPNK